MLRLGMVIWMSRSTGLSPYANVTPRSSIPFVNPSIGRAPVGSR